MDALVQDPKNVAVPPSHQRAARAIARATVFKVPQGRASAFTGVKKVARP